MIRTRKTHLKPQISKLEIKQCLGRIDVEECSTVQKTGNFKSVVHVIFDVQCILDRTASATCDLYLSMS